LQDATAIDTDRRCTLLMFPVVHVKKLFPAPRLCQLTLHPSWE